MVQYVVYSSQTKKAKVKGELPDIIYSYIAHDSMISWHYTFTSNIEDAYYFDEFENDVAKKISLLCNMKMKKLDV